MSPDPNPYAPPGSVSQPPEVNAADREAAAQGAKNLQLMGILSIVFAICCPLIGIGLGAVTLGISGRTTAAASRIGASDLLDKIATGKTCAAIGLAIGLLNSAVGAITAVVQALNQ